MTTEALLHILQEEHLLNLLPVDSVADKPSEWAEVALNLQVKNFLKAITSSTPDDTLLTLAEEHLSSIQACTEHVDIRLSALSIIVEWWR